MRDILATRGWSGLFVGYFGTQYRQTSWTAAYFGTLQFFSDQSKKVLKERGRVRECEEARGERRRRGWEGREEEGRMGRTRGGEKDARDEIRREGGNNGRDERRKERWEGREKEIRMGGTPIL